jgi:hypothetical protein
VLFSGCAGPAKSLRCRDSAPPFRFARTCRIPLKKEPGRMPSFSLQILQEKDGIALLPEFFFYSSSS